MQDQIQLNTMNEREKKAEAYNTKGIENHEIKRDEDAINYFDKSIKLNPQYAIAYYNRGCAKSALGKYEDAVKEFRQGD